MELPEQDRQALIEAARRRGQGGAAFGVYPSSGKRPEKLNVSRDVNMPAQVARGWVAGTLGLPGDIEGLGRMALGLAGADVSETPVLPTSDFYREYLPGYDPAPAAKFASGLGALTGGLGSTKLAGAAVKGAKATGKALGPKAAEMAEGYLQRSGLAPTVVKPKGGNWLSGSVEGATERLKTIQLDENNNLITPESVTPEMVSRNPDLAVNNWIDTKLNKYIRNEMGTPEDPVRKLAERDVLHFEPVTGPLIPSQAKALANKRVSAGMPAAPIGESELARKWETLADKAIDPYPAEAYKYGSLEEDFLASNPWLEKVPDEAMVYKAKGLERGLGFDHLIDELRNATRADSDLPANLRWKPEDLKKVTMEQAVERVAKINEYRAAKKAEANEALARNPATAPYKDYQTVPGTQEPNQKGLAWKQIRPQEGYGEESYRLAQAGDKEGFKSASAKDAEMKKALADALKYEGDVMGHCVGGYCDDVLSGRSQIYSLRDKKGEPHVTIEVRPAQARSDPHEMQAIENQVAAEADARNFATLYERDRFYFPRVEELQMQMLDEKSKNLPPEIIQIKGKGNAAPKAEYLPFVQDFVRSGNWSRVGDLKNTGLIKLGDQYLPKEEVGPLVERASRFIEETPALREHREAQRAYENYSGPVPSAEYTALQRAAGRQVHPTIPYTYRELRAILDDPDAFADRNTDALAPNLERIERLRQLVGEQGYAKGGLVEDTDAIAAKLTGMDKDKALTHALRMANAKQEAHMAAGGLAKVLKGAKKAEDVAKAAKATEKAAEAVKPAVKGPQAEALETARKNAVKMLGLPENNTAMDRAKALGFDTAGFRGSSVEETAHTKPIWWSEDPEYASAYAAHTVRPPKGKPDPYAGNVMPLLVKEGASKEFERFTPGGVPLDPFKGFNEGVETGFRRYAQNEITGDLGGKIWEGLTVPKNVRSRFAAFDPARINENDLLGAADPALLAGTAVASGIGLGALGQMSKPKPKQEEKKKAAGGLAKRM